MQKICAIILLSGLVLNLEALPQTKWSRPIPNVQGQLIRERRQFPFGEWIPLSQPCPTCRPFADPLDVGLRGENIGLTPPRPPTVTRQIHGEGNFFPQDESSILSVPPPPPSAIPRQPLGNVNGNFQNLQFSGFGQQFNNPLPVPTQQIFPQTQQVQFLPQTFLSNQPLLVNNNQQVLPNLNSQNTLFGQENQVKQQNNNGKVQNFNTQKLPENVVLEQNKRPVAGKQFSSKPTPFTLSQQNQQQGVAQQQTFGGQHQSVNFGNSILTPPPAPKNVSQDIVIPGLDKEEIQLLYVPVETLRQRGNFQEQLLSQQHQNIQFHNRPNGLQQPVSSHRPTEQPTTTQPKGHFVTQSGKAQEQSVNTLKVTSPQPFPSTVTPSTLLLQHLPFQQTPQPFVSATPATPTIQPFVTPSSVSQKFSPFTPETTLSHLVTIPNTIQFSQSDLEFGTTPKTLLNQGAFQEEIINGKSQFSGFKNTAFQNQELQQPKQENVQLFVNQQQPGTQQQNTVFHQEQPKELNIQNNFAGQQLIDQQQIALQKQQEQQRLIQQQKEKELQEQYLLKQRQQKELEAQRLLQQQRQKEIDEQRLLQQQQRQKELEEQRLLQQQRQKELEEQRLLQQQRQKELEQQRFLQQQRQKELEEQQLLQQQRQKELENQRRLQLQRQAELEEKRRLQQLKQREEEQQRLIRFQQQQKELEQQRILQQQKEEQERLHQQQLLQRQKQENLKKQQQFQLFQQQQQQQQLQQQQQQQQPKQQSFPQNNRHTLPANDKLNFISQLEKESEPETNLVPHQPPLSVFFKAYEGADAKIVDVLRELRSSKTITVLDQYFEKMPKVFVGPAGLIPPAGYRKFELPYLSNLETNRIERKIDRLPFFVAPLNFVPPPGYAKIPFPAPHVGSVVVSSESNPAMKVKSPETAITLGAVQEEQDSGSFPMVGPELPGLINGLETETTTIKPTAFPSTPSLPQTTAQLRNRRPNNSVYRPQSRKPVSKTRVQTTVRPEEEVTQPIPKVEVTKDSESGLRKPFNRFLNRRRQQAKTTTEVTPQTQPDRKNLENRHYTVEVYHNEKNTNQLPGHQQKSDILRERQNQGHRFGGQFEHQASNIDRTTPGGHEAFEVHPTPNFYQTQTTGVSGESEERRPELSDYSDLNLQSFEDGPLPTGSAKTITQELYRPNAIQLGGGELNSKSLTKVEDIEGSEKLQPGSYEKFEGVNPTAAGVTSQKDIQEEQIRIQPTISADFEKPEAPQSTSASFYATEAPRTEFSLTPGSVTVSGEHQTKGFLDSNEQYTSAFAEISKHHHIPGPTESSKRHQTKYSDVSPTPEISLDLQAPLTKEYSQEQYPNQYGISDKVQPTQDSINKFSPTATSNEQYLAGFGGIASNEQHGVSGESFSDVSSSQVSPTAPGATQEQYTTGFSVNNHGQNSAQFNRPSEDQRTGSFISFQNIHSTVNSPVSPQVQYFPSSTPVPSPEYASVSEGNKHEENPKNFEHSQVVGTPETGADIIVHPSPETYKSESASEDSIRINDQKQTTEGQNVADNLSNDHRLKLPNPSIVRVRTRVRGKPRGQVNFAASQSTTPSPIIRSKVETKTYENSEVEDATTKSNYFRDHQPVKTSKYNQYRGLKKASRPTTEPTTEHEQKANVYTIRPQRRPSSPSTVSTKRIRRPTTPIPSVETATEAFGISTTSAPYSENADFAPSGVSNDVYYEHTSLSPIRQKFRKFFGSAEQKNDVVPSFASTEFPSTAPTHQVPIHQDSYSEEANIVKDLSQTQENSEKYPEWNPSESGLDVSGIVLTTIRTPGQEEEQEVEEPKKFQESKKAFDPDLEKKSGRRRVRVRVHKRPHENFETAESQNLRTVANVLVPPTTTYKPNDDSNIHQLAKNSDFSFGGQKLFGLRSREYFRKRLNLTETENGDSKKEGINDNKEEENVQKSGQTTETGPKLSGFVRKTEKAQKSEFESVSAPSGEGVEGSKVGRPKFRGYVRKIVKPGRVHKEDSESNHSGETEESEGHQDNVEHHPKQIRVNQGGFNHTGRLNGTRHRTFVRYVKKNKVRPHEAEISQEVEKEEQGHQSTEVTSQTPENQQTLKTEQNTEYQEEKSSEKRYPVYHGTKKTDIPKSSVTKEYETEEPEIRQTTQGSDIGEAHETSSHTQESEESASRQTPQSETSVTQQSGLYLTQKPKFYQTLRPVFPRPTHSGFQRTREPGSYFSTTENAVKEVQEKRDGPIRPKYGKPTGYGTTGVEKSEETKKANEQVKNKNLHTLEVRKYLRTKNREGIFSQFSKNRFFTSEKTETVATTNAQNNEGQDSEEITVPSEKAVETKSEFSKTESTSIETEPKTTQAFVTDTDSTEIGETTKNDEDFELHQTTTEIIENSSEEDEESSEEEEDKNNTTPVKPDTTTETRTEVPTTIFQAPSSEAPQTVTESKTEEVITERIAAHNTETQPDLYRFSKSSFSFDEAEKFTGTKNRAHVRNITADIIENTASFSAPGVEKRTDIILNKPVAESEPAATTTEAHFAATQKTEEATTELDPVEATTDYPGATETETTAATEAVTKAKIAKLIKTSTTTKVSHETEICYKGKCIRTKSENPDEDLKLLVDSASTMKIGKTKT